jgi:Phage T4 tail fibre
MKKLSIILLSLSIKVALLAQWTTSGANIYNSNSGNVGIGTNSPAALFEVRKDQADVTRILVTNSAVGPNVKSRVHLTTGTTNSYAVSELQDANGNPYYLFGTGSAVTGSYFDSKSFSWRNLSGITLMNINTTGNVGIGTSSPGTFKLAVEGKIGAREIQVTNISPWPDYVFNKGYKLMALSKIEKFIKQNSHLPGVPSAADVIGGVQLGKMSAILLEKVEELTLYMIELNKKIEKLEKENIALRTR